MRISNKCGRGIMKQLLDYQEKEEQLYLFPQETKKSAKEAASFSDPAFASNKTMPVHRWVPWIAGFSSDFVKQALEKHLSRKGTVLDPFAGVGTTLIESIKSG